MQSFLNKYTCLIISYKFAIFSIDFPSHNHCTLSPVYCIPESTTSAYGSYNWPLTEGNVTVQQQCMFKEDHIVRRTCSRVGLWIAVDFSDCGMLQPLWTNNWCDSQWHVNCIAHLSIQHSTYFNNELHVVHAILHCAFTNSTWSSCWLWRCTAEHWEWGELTCTARSQLYLYNTVLSQDHDY